ncbi:thermonuclease family protein [Hansschlegelia plantiphila]|nr:thermonuclease family protein [Hansschlegelia plantiphila]
MIRPALLLALLATPALAEPPAAFMDYARAPAVRVIDGDTIDIDGERIRLTSEDGPIDAPEMHRAKCPLELFRAQAARERLIAIMAPNDFTIERRGKDRYGRTVGVIYSEGKDVGAELVREGHARPWPKLRKADRPAWCGGAE